VKKTACFLVCGVLFVCIIGCISPSILDGTIRPVDSSIRPKLAIVSDNRLADAIGTELFTRGFVIIERLRLLSVIREKSLQLTGKTDEQFIEAGKLLNVEALLFVTTVWGERGDIHTAYIKIVNVDDGAVIAAFNYQNGHGPAKDNPHEAARKIAERISGGYK